MHHATSLWTWLLALAIGLSSGACGRRHNASPEMARARVDSINDLAYRSHYRDIDVVRQLASEAYELADSIRYADGMAEALNNLAFERFQQMDFDSAQVIAADIAAGEADEVERLVADVMLMKVAQRTSDNLAFFRHRSFALQRIERLERQQQRMTPRRRRRFDFARGDLHIVASTYFYYLDQQERAIAEIRDAETYCRLSEDTAQWLYYSYMRGSGGLSDNTDPVAIAREEFDYLLPCFWLARRERYTFFEANAEQSLATLFADSLRLQAVAATQPEVIAMLTSVFSSSPKTYIPDDEVAEHQTATDDGANGAASPLFDTAMRMAEAAFEHFLVYDDLYQQACALRTLGELSFADGRYHDAIGFYAQALACVNFHHQCYYAPDQVLASPSGMPEAQPSASSAAPSPDLLSVYDPSPRTESVERLWMRLPQVKTVPEWIAGIRQHLSVAFSALDMKAESDFNRNIYLDLLDVTREDAELESRAAELNAESRKLVRTWAAVGIVAVLIIAFVLYLLHNWRRRIRTQNRLIGLKIQQLHDEAQRQREAFEEEQEQLREQQAATELRLLRDKQQNVEKRAKLQLVAGIQPLLNRVIHEVERMKQRGQTSPAALDYISELTESITQYNELLTEWIQMRQGQLALQLSSFPLEPLFETLRHSHFAFDQKGIALDVASTGLSVKADRALTLFMLNTLADNARKFTPKGGRVAIAATEGADTDGRYVELSVQDTGCGMTAEDVDLILNNKVYDAGKIGHTPKPDDFSHQWETPKPLTPKASPTNGTPSDGQKGFGFGLMNCKGIIEKYRKTSPLFAVCRFGIESRVGEGSRFWFRLPRVASMVIAVLMSMHVGAAVLPCFGQSLPTAVSTHRSDRSAARSQQHVALGRAYAFADSVYYCNLDERYTDAVAFADSAFFALNQHYASIARTTGRHLALFEQDTEAAEVKWWREKADVDYSLLLGLRNEVAIAALALHDWPLYRYNNRIYTRLYKLTNQDTTLESFCQQTERSQQTERWAIIVLGIVFVLATLAFGLFYVRPQMAFRRKMAQLHKQRLAQMQHQEATEHERRQSDFEMAEDEHRRRLFEESRLHVQNMIIDNALSTIKHETMYYPGRIRQLVDYLKSSSDQVDLLNTLSETVGYYNEVHGLLSAQASSQSAAVNFKRRRLSLDMLTEKIASAFSARQRRQGLDATLNIVDATAPGASADVATRFLGDPDLIVYLLGELFDYELSATADAQAAMPAAMPDAEPQPIRLTLTGQLDGHFLRLTLDNPFVAFTDAELHDFFMPHHGAIPLLVCKQIIREHDTFLGHPGCRINADRAGEGHRVWFTLPLVNSNNP